jgi:hypothetical protein
LSLSQRWPLNTGLTVYMFLGGRREDTKGNMAIKLHYLWGFSLCTAAKLMLVNCCTNIWIVAELMIVNCPREKFHYLGTVNLKKKNLINHAKYGLLCRWTNYYFTSKSIDPVTVTNFYDFVDPYIMCVNHQCADLVTIIG